MTNGSESGLKSTDQLIKKQKAEIKSLVEVLTLILDQACVNGCHDYFVGDKHKVEHSSICLKARRVLKRHGVKT